MGIIYIILFVPIIVLIAYVVKHINIVMGRVYEYNKGLWLLGLIGLILLMIFFRSRGL